MPSSPTGPGCWMLVVGCWLLDVGCWMLVVGCWLLDVGCWMLVVGCWLLDVGCSAVAPASSAKENPPDNHQHRQHGKQGVFENKPQKGRCVDMLLIGDGLDHEVRTVADVGIGAKKNRANADRQDVFVVSQIAEQEADFNLVLSHSSIEQVRRVIALQHG